MDFKNDKDRKKYVKSRAKLYGKAKKRLKRWENFQKPKNVPYDFTKWKLYDIYKAFGMVKKPYYYGIYMFCGLYGQGKTMACTEYLERLRKKHGDNIIIATNFYYKSEDFHLESWKQMLDKYDKTAIFAIDEVQNEFGTRDYRNFPHSLITLLTQNRKGNGVQLVTTAQRYDHVDKIFRDLCSHIFECRTYFGRLTVTKRYQHAHYQMYNNGVSVSNKRKIPMIKYKFVQTNYLRDQYDTLRMIDETAKKLVAEEENDKKPKKEGEKVGKVYEEEPRKIKIGS